MSPMKAAEPPTAADGGPAVRCSFAVLSVVSGEFAPAAECERYVDQRGFAAGDEGIMSQLRAVQIERFKAIENAPFDLGPLNVLVGANNSGKSSIIQGLHFGVGLFQTIELAGNWTSGDSISTSINPTQLI
jgi:AAA ATPase domain